MTGRDGKGSLAIMMRGRFITLEGGEGAGKSTQRAAIASALRQVGLKVLETREPGGSPGAEEIRELIVRGDPGRWDRETEALLVFAARRDHLQRLILPALEQGQWVVCDRFSDSPFAYQGYGRGVEVESLRELHRFCAGDLLPDLTFLLDLPVEAGLARAAHRGGAERFEALGLDFHERVRKGFLLLAAQEPERFVLINASLPPEEVTQAVLKQLEQRLGLTL